MRWPSIPPVASLRLALGALCVSACTHVTVATPISHAPPPNHGRVAAAWAGDAAAAPIDTILVASIRPLDDGDDTRFGDSLAFALVTQARDDGGLRRDLGVTPLTRDAFRAMLGRSVAPVVVSVHGAGSGRTNAWRRALDGRRLAGHTGPWVVFQWPARGSRLERGGSPWALPMLTAYRRDRERALASAGALAETISLVTEVVPPARVSVLAHSAGARVLGEALASEPALVRRLRPSPLHAVAFFAADVDPAHFSDHYLPAAHYLATRVVRYASRDDRMLQLARRVHGRERLGLLTDAPDVLAHAPSPRAAPARALETVDITAGDAVEPPVIGAFYTHHSEHQERDAMQDFVHIVVADRPAACREQLGVAVQDGRAWRLLPSDSAAYRRACSVAVSPPR